MHMTSRSTIYTTAALQYLAVFAGLAWAKAAEWHPDLVPTLWLVPTVLGLVLLAIVACTAGPGPRTRGAVIARGVAAAMLVYSGFMVWLDPFASATNEANGLLAVAFVVVPLLGLKVLVREREWLAICGVILCQSAAIASLIYNAGTRWGGTGYFSFMYRVVY
jgi:hypothetical protein